MKKQIFNSMMEEHKLIENLLSGFETLHYQNSTNAKKLFEAFSWNIEKHIFFEEKMIYSIYPIWNANMEGMFEILQDHGDILNLIKKIKTSHFTQEDVETLKNTLKEHFELEEEVLYPQLEKILNKQQKEDFLDRATEFLVA
jgi:hemerythrin-like domain-containing protein